MAFFPKDSFETTSLGRIEATIASSQSDTATFYDVSSVAVPVLSQPPAQPVAKEVKGNQEIPLQGKDLTEEVEEYSIAWFLKKAWEASPTVIQKAILGGGSTIAFCDTERKGMSIAGELRELTGNSYLYQILGKLAEKISGSVQGFIRDSKAEGSIKDFCAGNQNFINDIIAYVLPLVALNIIKNYSKLDDAVEIESDDSEDVFYDAIEEKDVIVGAITHFLGEINKEFKTVYPKVQLLMAEFPGKDEESKKNREKALHEQVFLPLADKVLKMVLRNGPQDLPVIQKIGDKLWQMFHDEYLPHGLSVLYTQFMDPQSKVDMSQLAEMPKSLVSLVSNVIEKQLPLTIAKFTEKNVIESTKYLFTKKETDQLPRWLDNVLNGVFHSPEMQTMWHFIGSSVEPVVAHILTHSKITSLNGLIEKVLAMRAAFVAEHADFIRARLNELKGLNKKPSDDPVLIAKFNSLSLTILREFGVYKEEIVEGVEKEKVLLPIAELLQDLFFALLKDQLPRILIGNGSIDVYSETVAIKDRLAVEVEQNRDKLKGLYQTSHVTEACHALAQFVCDFVPHLVNESKGNFAQKIFDVVAEKFNALGISEIQVFLKTNAKEVKKLIETDLQGLAKREGPQVKELWPSAKPFMETFFLDIFATLTDRIYEKQTADKEYLVKGALDLFNVMKDHFKTVNAIRKDHGGKAAHGVDSRVYLEEFDKQIKNGKDLEARKAIARYKNEIKELKESLATAIDSEKKGINNLIHKAEAKLEKALEIVKENGLHAGISKTPAATAAREAIASAKQEVEKQMRIIAKKKTPEAVADARIKLKAKREELNKAQDVLDKTRKENFIKPFVDKLMALVKLDPQNIERLPLPAPIREKLYEALRENLLPEVFTSIFNKLLDSHTLNSIILNSLEAFNDTMEEGQVVKKLSQMRSEIIEWEKSKAKAVKPSDSSIKRIDHQIAKKQKQIEKLLNENENKFELVKTLHEKLKANDMAQFDAIISKIEAPKVAKEDVLQHDLDQASGEMVVEMMGMFDDSLINTIFASESTRHQLAAKIGSSVRQSLSEDSLLLKIIDKSIKAGLPNLGGGKWVGYKNAESFVGEDELDLQYTFTATPEEKEAEELKKFNERVATEEKLVEAIKNQPKKMMDDMIKSWWEDFQFAFDQGISKIFGSIGAEVKSFLDGVCRAIFLVGLGAFFMFITYLLRKAIDGIVRLHMERLAKDLIKNMNMDVHENLVYRGADAIMQMMQR